MFSHAERKRERQKEREKEKKNMCVTSKQTPDHN